MRCMKVVYTNTHNGIVEYRIFICREEDNTAAAEFMRDAVSNGFVINTVQFGENLF